MNGIILSNTPVGPASMTQRVRGMRKLEKSFKIISKVRLGRCWCKGSCPLPSAPTLIVMLRGPSLHHGFVSLTKLILLQAYLFVMGSVVAFPHHYFITRSENRDTAFHGFFLGIFRPRAWSRSWRGGLIKWSAFLQLFWGMICPSIHLGSWNRFEVLFVGLGLTPVLTMWLGWRGNWFDLISLVSSPQPLHGHQDPSWPCYWRL